MASSDCESIPSAGWSASPNTPTSVGTSNISFQTTSSLQGMSSTPSGAQSGTATSGHQVSAKAINNKNARPKVPSPHTRKASGLQVNVTMNAPGAPLRKKPARPAASVNHISGFKDGSPMKRKPVGSRANNPRDARGFHALNTKSQDRVLSGFEGKFKEIPANPEGVEKPPLSNPEVEDAIRRSETYDFGPTVRFATDAHEVIMGSKAISRTSNGANKSDSKPFVNNASRVASKSLPLKVSVKDRDFQERRRTSDYPIRTSSLPKPLPKPKPMSSSFVERLSRPTAASASRAAANNLLNRSETEKAVKKGTKGLRSRLSSFSSIIPGRRRSGSQVSLDVSQSIAPAVIKESTEDLSTVTEEASHKNDDLSVSGVGDSSSLTIFEDSGIELGVEKQVRIYQHSESTAARGDQMSTDYHIHQQPINLGGSGSKSHPASASVIPASVVVEIPKAAQVNDINVNNPTNPRSSDNPRGSYLETLFRDARRHTKEAVAVAENADALTKEAENNLRTMLASMAKIKEEEVRKCFVPVAEAIADSIFTLRGASQNAIQATENAHRIASNVYGLSDIAARAVSEALRDFGHAKELREEIAAIQAGVHV